MTARRELVWFYDLAGDRVAATRHDILDIWTDERFGQSEQFGFTLPADHPKAGYVVVDAELRHRGRQYFVTEVEVRRDDAAAVIAVEADATWYRLGDNPYVGTFLADDVTTLAGIEQILAGTGWTADAEATSTSSTTFSMELDDRSRLELLRGWAKVTGTYLKFSTTRKQVALAAAPGIDSNISFRYARNLLGARKRTRPPELTRVYPYGADGLSVAGINGGLPYVEDLSYYTDQGLTDDQAARLARGRVWSDPAFIREADLLSAATAYLADRSSPEVSYELKVVDLAEVTDITERARIGDTVRVYDPEIAAGGLRPIVTRFRRHWLEPWRNEIELSTILDPLGDLTSSNGRPSSSDEWQQFTGPIRAEYRIRNDATYTVARIPLRFREGGRANYHLDFQATGVGAGTMLVEVSDANNDDEVKFRDVSIDYTDGQTVTVALDWAAEELAGAYNYRLRVTTVADGGPSTSAGVNILADADTPEQEASFYIMAQGAVQETPTAANSETFTFTGAVQSFTVPDNVDELTITANGAPGGGATRGLGGRVTATVPVTPGADLDVYVGGKGNASGGGGGSLVSVRWPPRQRAGSPG